ncbi:Semaphorin-5A [Mactra antiquata]
MGCSGNQFRCRDGVCINANQLCDGLQHCSANEDELICEPRGCTANQFACDDGKCIAATQVCDGEQNCINNEDETICPRKGCERNQLTCFDKCVNASSLCNGVVDCPNGADESDCSFNGEYTDWSAWGTCSETCDMGTQTRTRTCTNPAPQFGGLDCMGPAMEQQMCQIIPCPINGGYTDWSAWGTCSETCDMGTQTRTRTCTNPAPQFGGLNCMGPAMEQQMCQIIPCPSATDCPMTLPDVGGVVYPVVTDFSVGVTVDYDCTTICGFTALSGGTIECQADLTWSLPSCSGNIPVGAPVGVQTGHIEEQEKSQDNKDGNLEEEIMDKDQAGDDCGQLFVIVHDVQRHVKNDWCPELRGQKKRKHKELSDSEQEEAYVQLWKRARESNDQKFEKIYNTFIDNGEESDTIQEIAEERIQPFNEKEFIVKYQTLIDNYILPLRNNRLHTQIMAQIDKLISKGQKTTPAVIK